MSTPTSIVDNVSDTALWVAVYRERETARPDALFRDPLASRLTGERGKLIEKKMTGSKFTDWTVVIRTCIIDKFIQDLIAEGVDTIVNLGCGLDTRPYRLNLPKNLRWIEVDFQQIIKLKEERLSDQTPTCRLERVTLDLTNDELRQTFFSKINSESSKILVITEGVLPYLSLEQAASLARALRLNSNFKFWIGEYLAPEVYRHINTRTRRRQMKNAPFLFFPPDWFAFFKEHGWKKREIYYLAEESEKLGRAIPVPWWGRVLGFVFRPKDASKYKRFSGYVIFEPG